MSELKQEKTTNYPFNDEYEFSTIMERINLDKEKEFDVYSGNGFIITEPKSIKKDLKDPDGIFSTRYGQGLSDLNPYVDRYKCECGHLKSRVNHDMECPLCHTKVKYVSDNYEYFGWLSLRDNYYIIHPNFYKSIEYLFGSATKTEKEKHSKLYNIIKYAGLVDQEGHDMELEETPADQPFYGIGMIDFHNRFDEIMDYYHQKYPNKSQYYDDIMEHRDKIFIQSIPVFTTHLRPCDIKDNNTMYFEPINAMYNIMNKLVSEINKNNTMFSRKKKPKNQLLFDLQCKYGELYTEIEAILSGKKGTLRSLIGGRYNFSSRSVIAQKPYLRIDQVSLPYTELVITQQQKIINILERTYKISPAEAYDIWYKAQSHRDERVAEIIQALIDSTPIDPDTGKPQGIPILLNRNPTINYGSILQMFCTEMNNTFTIGIPLQILKLLAADFDGDVLNVFHIINDAFFQRCNEVFNPRNAMYLSRNNGTFNSDVSVQRDTLICSNTLMRLGRNNYTDQQKAKIKILLENRSKTYNF